MQTSDRAGLTVTEACKYLGVGRTKLYELISENALQTILIGGRRIVLRRSIDRLIDEAINLGALEGQTRSEIKAALIGSNENDK